MKAKFKVFPVTYRGEKDIPLEQEVNEFLKAVEGEIVDVKMETVVDASPGPFRGDIDLFLVVIYKKEKRKGG